MMIKVCILDFDGVILESVDIKGEVFRVLFQDHPGKVKEILDYHYANGGISRFEKFKHIYAHILKEPLAEGAYQVLCERFSCLAYQKVLAASFVPGALEFLKEYATVYDLYIVSGTPDEELKRIVEARGLTGFFKGVHGSPRNKIFWTRKILADSACPAGNAVWLGDALSDLEAAQDLKIPFVARLAVGKDVFAGQLVRWVIQDLRSFEGTLRKIERERS